MIRGEYDIRIGDGPVRTIPNQVTIVGMQALLKAMFWQQPLALKVGLCAANPASMISLAAVQEPAVANGYARLAVPMDQVNWYMGSVNGESFAETRELIFPLVNPGTTIPVNRMFLTDGVNVISISSAFDEGMQIRSAPITTKYRLFFG